MSSQKPPEFTKVAVVTDTEAPAPEVTHCVLKEHISSMDWNWYTLVPTGTFMVWFMQPIASHTGAHRPPVPSVPLGQFSQSVRFTFGVVPSWQAEQGIPSRLTNCGPTVWHPTQTALDGMLCVPGAQLLHTPYGLNSPSTQSMHVTLPVPCRSVPPSGTIHGSGCFPAGQAEQRAAP